MTVRANASNLSIGSEEAVMALQGRFVNRPPSRAHHDAPLRYVLPPHEPTFEFDAFALFPGCKMWFTYGFHATLEYTLTKQCRSVPELCWIDLCCWTIDEFNE